MQEQTANERQLLLFPERMSISHDDAMRILVAAQKMRAAAMSSMIKSLFSAIVQTVRTASNMRTLSELSDATLADIGIDRSQIPAIAEALAKGEFDRETLKPHVAAVAVAKPAPVQNEDEPELPLAA